MISLTFPPSPHLAHIVQQYWYVKTIFPAPQRIFYPTPLLQGLVFNFSELREHHYFKDQTVSLHKKAYIFGQTTSVHEVYLENTYVEALGVRFLPLGIGILTGFHMAEFIENFVDPEDIWGNEIELLWEEMQTLPTVISKVHRLEKFLYQISQRATQPRRVDTVQHALQHIVKSQGSLKMNSLQDKTYTSRKTLERSFLQVLGTTPKLYSRIIRFNWAKQLLDQSSGKDICDIAYRLGYYDNSHFAADFKIFAGVSAREYVNNKPYKTPIPE